MKILNLYVENIKRIKAVDISPSSNTVIIAGRNGNGKSSAIDAIAMALGGQKLIPSQPVRTGEMTAEIRVDLGDYIVTRNWTNPLTSYLKLENKEGGKIGNAQTILDKIIGNLTFDPLEFATMEPKKRLKILKDITNVNFDALDAEYKNKYEDRHTIGRELNAYAAKLENDYKELPEKIPAAIEIKEVLALKEQAQSENNKIAAAKEEMDRCDAQIRDAELAINSNLRQIADLERSNDALKAVIEQKITGRMAARTLSEKPKFDLTQYDGKITEAVSISGIISKFAERDKVLLFTAQTKSKYDDLTTQLDKIVSTKKMVIETAAMPVKGLSFGDDEVLFNAIPFNQLSTSEQIRVSFAVAIALNPKLRVAIIKNGSLLDSNALAMIENIAKDKDFQVWVERVADSPESGVVYIEDGHQIQEIREAAGK